MLISKKNNGMPPYEVIFGSNEARIAVVKDSNPGLRNTPRSLRSLHAGFRLNMIRTQYSELAASRFLYRRTSENSNFFMPFCWLVFLVSFSFRWRIISYWRCQLVLGGGHVLTHSRNSLGCVLGLSNLGG